MTFCLLLFVLSILPSFAQNNEPANNIGKSLSLMKQQFQKQNAADKEIRHG